VIQIPSGLLEILYFLAFVLASGHIFENISQIIVIPEELINDVYDFIFVRVIM
jgi:hypothetical protein